MSDYYLHELLRVLQDKDGFVFEFDAELLCMENQYNINTWINKSRDFQAKDCLNIVTVDKDFSKIKTNQELAQHVNEILKRLKTFKIPVHPRVRLFYELLKQGMTNYAHKTSDSLYKPDKFNLRSDNRI